MIDDSAREPLRTDDVALLKLGFDWMKNVMFQEHAVSLREEVMQGAIAKARNDLGVT